MASTAPLNVTDSRHHQDDAIYTILGKIITKSQGNDEGYALSLRWLSLLGPLYLHHKTVAHDTVT